MHGSLKLTFNVGLDEGLDEGPSDGSGVGTYVGCTKREILVHADIILCGKAYLSAAQTLTKGVRIDDGLFDGAFEGDSVGCRLEKR